MDLPAPPAAHLCLSLLFVASLPAPPSVDDANDDALAYQDQRQSLDVCCLDEEEFGLTVAAIRTLLAELQSTAVAIVASTAAPAHKTLWPELVPCASATSELFMRG